MDENYNNQNNDYTNNQGNVNNQNPYNPQPQTDNQNAYGSQQNNYQNGYSQPQNGYQNNQNGYNYNPQPNYQNGYNQPQQYYQDYNDDSKGLAVASLVLGIVSFFCCGSICSIVGLILGIVARKKNSVNNGMATAGIVLSIIALVLWAVYFVFVIVYSVEHGNYFYRFHY
ncbi:MAG: DUF4190 domain-containing protein [Ruminococcus sp.]